MKKKYIGILLSVCFCLSIVFGMSACGKTDGKYSIVCSNFPQYDWVMRILGERSADFSVKYLLSSGIELHDYESQKSVDDMIAISSCDLFVYVGGESDGWAEAALAGKTNANRITVAMIDIVEAKEEEIIEGMEGEESEDGHDGETEYDEHVWLSLRNAQVIVAAIADAICEIDGENAAEYKANAASYNAALASLDGEYVDTVAAANRNTLLFADRFPFRYLVDDYNLEYFAAFVGCSSETEASFETIIFLADKVDELQLNVILVIETSDMKIAQTVKENSRAKNQTVLVMHSCQSVSSREISAGATYLSIMTDNLSVLSRALA